MTDANVFPSRQADPIPKPPSRTHLCKPNCASNFAHNFVNIQGGHQMCTAKAVIRLISFKDPPVIGQENWQVHLSLDSSEIILACGSVGSLFSLSRVKSNEQTTMEYRCILTPIYLYGSPDAEKLSRAIRDYCADRKCCSMTFGGRSFISIAKWN